jgi:hypothetical protein
MKNIFLLSLLMICMQSFAQQKSFLDYEKYKITFETSYLNFESHDNIDGDYVGENVQHLHISFTLDPESSDAVKEEKIKEIERKLKETAPFCKKTIKVLSLQIGEQLFLNGEEVASCGDNYDKLAKLNLKNAWKRLSPILQKEFPSIEIYADNWGW